MTVVFTFSTKIRLGGMGGGTPCRSGALGGRLSWGDPPEDDRWFFESNAEDAPGRFRRVFFESPLPLAMRGRGSCMRSAIHLGRRPRYPCSWDFAPCVVASVALH